jgi:hypothetical protein
LEDRISGNPIFFFCFLFSRLVWQSGSSSLSWVSLFPNRYCIGIPKPFHMTISRPRYIQSIFPNSSSLFPLPLHRKETSQLHLPHPLHQFLPHNTKISIIGTNLVPLQLLINGPRGPVGVLAQLVDAQHAVLDVVVFGVLLVAPVTDEREPVGGVP